MLYGDEKVETYNAPAYTPDEASFSTYKDLLGYTIRGEMYGHTTVGRQNSALQSMREIQRKGKNFFGHDFDIGHALSIMNSGSPIVGDETTWFSANNILEDREDRVHNAFEYIRQQQREYAARHHVSHDHPFMQDPEELSHEIMTRYEDDAEKAWDRAPSGPIAGTISGMSALSGMVIGAGTDPWNIFYGVVGGATAPVTMTWGGLALGAAWTGAIGMTGEALLMDKVTAWREDAGRPYDKTEVAARLLGAGIGAGLFDAVGRVAMRKVMGSRGWVPKFDEGERIIGWQTVEEMANAKARAERPRVQSARDLPPDAPARRGVEGDLDAALEFARSRNDQGLIDMIIQAKKDAKRKPIAGKLPEGTPFEEIADRINEAIKHMEDPIGTPPPRDLDVPGEKVVPNFADARENDLPKTLNVGDTVHIGGKKVQVESWRLDEQDLVRIAGSEGARPPESGSVNVAKRGSFNPKKAGRVIIFEKNDGSKIILDGGRRMELARKIAMEKGERAPEVSAIVLREKDKWDYDEARAIAGKKNLKEQNIDELDAAHIFRNSPEVYDSDININNRRVQIGKQIASMSEEGYRLAMGGNVDPRMSALVAKRVPKERQGAAMEEIVGMGKKIRNAGAVDDVLARHSSPHWTPGKIAEMAAGDNPHLDSTGYGAGEELVRDAAKSADEQKVRSDEKWDSLMNETQKRSEEAAKKAGREAPESTKVGKTEEMEASTPEGKEVEQLLKRQAWAQGQGWKTPSMDEAISEARFVSNLMGCKLV